MADTGKFVLILSGMFGVLRGADLTTDYLKGGTGTHLVLEGLLLLISGAMFIAGLRQLNEARREIKSLQVDVEKLHEEKEKWKGETHQLLAGL